MVNTTFIEFLSLKKEDSYCADFGSCQTKIAKGDKLVFFEPTCIAIHTTTGQTIAIGSKAYQLLGREPEQVQVIFPIKYGVIAHPDAFISFVQTIFARLSRRPMFQRVIVPDIVQVLMPRVITPAHKYILTQTFARLPGIRYLLRDTGDALVQYYQRLGYRPPIAWILDVGGDSSYVAVYYDKKLISSKIIRWGSMEFGQYIQDVLLEKYGCQLSWQQAENVKKTVTERNDAHQKKKKVSELSIVGKDSMSQLLKTVSVKQKELEDVLNSHYHEVLQELEVFLAELPVETVTAMLEEGISLSGGGSQLAGLDTYLAEHLQTSARVAKEPELAVIKGCVQ